MAIIHPPLPDIKLINAGAYRERDILQQLQSGLPHTFDAYHTGAFKKNENTIWTEGQLFAETVS